jgi:hypothetical protein
MRSTQPVAAVVAATLDKFAAALVRIEAAA